MKVKMKPVTNSSSTSFVLKSHCLGIIPHLDYDLEKTILELFPFSMTDQPGISTKNFVYFRSHPKMEKEFDTINYNAELEQICYWDPIRQTDENEDPIEMTRVYISTFMWCGDDQDNKTLKFIKDFLRKIISKTDIDFANLTFSTHISEWEGDGWDGGCSLGPYNYCHEALANETKMGKIYIVNNKVQEEIVTNNDLMITKVGRIITSKSIEV